MLKGHVFFLADTSVHPGFYLDFLLTMTDVERLLLLMMMMKTTKILISCSQGVNVKPGGGLHFIPSTRICFILFCHVLS